MDGVSSRTISLDDELVVGRPPIINNSCARFKLETDDTFNCYRRHFVGKVILTCNITLLINFLSKQL